MSCPVTLLHALLVAARGRPSKTSNFSGQNRHHKLLTKTSYMYHRGRTVRGRKGKFNDEVITQGIGIGIFNDNIDENQTTTNHTGENNTYEYGEGGYY